MNSAARVLALGANPIGAAATGVLLQTASIDAMLWGLTVGTGILALATALTPSIRRAPLIATVQTAS